MEFFGTDEAPITLVQHSVQKVIGSYTTDEWLSGQFITMYKKFVEIWASHSRNKPLVLLAMFYFKSSWVALLLLHLDR